jgi:tetratricopeptide (TPR) repeat protein/S1-C subfamily serine protease
MRVYMHRETAMRRNNMFKAAALLLTLAGGVQAHSAARGQTPALDGPKSLESLPTGPLPRLERVTPGALAPKQIYHKLLPSTCWVVHEKRVGAESVLSFGTGWVVEGRRRLIVTNHHVIDGVDDVGVVFPILKDGRVVNDASAYRNGIDRITGTVIDRSPRCDLTLIQLATLPATAPAVTLATENPDPGERVFTLAAMAKGDENLWDFTSGSVRQVSRRHLADGGIASVVETDMPFNQGNSGGPVVNDRGELVAVVEGYCTDARLVSLSVAVDEVRRYLSECDRLVEPRTARDFLDRGDRRLGTGRHDLAIRDYADALRLDPSSSKARVARGRAFLAKKDYQTAMEDFDDVLRQDPESVAAYAGRGTCYLGLARHAEAIADMSQAIRREPDKALWYQKRASAYLRTRQYGLCLADLERAVLLDPDNVAYRGHRGELYSIFKRYKEAEADLLISINSEPQNSEWFLHLGVVYLDSKNFEAAVNLNTVALRVNDKEPRYYNNRGAAYIGLSRLDKGIADFAKAIELKPDYALAFRNAGQAYYKARAYSKAVMLLSKAIELSPRDPRAYWWRASCRAALGDKAGGDSDRRTAASLGKQQQRVVATQFAPSTVASSNER